MARTKQLECPFCDVKRTELLGTVELGTSGESLQFCDISCASSVEEWLDCVNVCRLAPEGSLIKTIESAWVCDMELDERVFDRRMMGVYLGRMIDVDPSADVDLPYMIVIDGERFYAQDDMFKFVGMTRFKSNDSRVDTDVKITCVHRSSRR